MRSTAPRTGHVVALVLLAAALPLTSCASQATSYCDAVAEAQSAWGDADANLRNPADAARFVAIVKRVEAVAPDEVKADWQSLLGLFEKFTAANPDLSALTAQMPGFETAAKRIETHAKETCGVDLAS